MNESLDSGSLSLADAFAPERGTILRIGTLKTEGRLFAMDPLTSIRTAPFRQRVPAGTWPVELLVTKHGPALARVVFSPTVPVRFELASTDDQDPRTLKKGQRFGYPVDAGTGCFADEDASMDPDAILAALDACSACAAHATGNDGRSVSFSTGGDGVFSSYFGFDASGEAVWLVTDLGLLDLALPETATDEAYRGETAKRALSALLDVLPLLGSDRHGEVYDAMSALSELEEAAAPALTELLPILIAAGEDADGEMRIDVLAHAVGQIGATEAGARILAPRVAELGELALTRVAARLARARRALGEPLTEALAARWPAAGPALRRELLSAFRGERRVLDPRFLGWAEDALEMALASPDDSEATEMALAAVDPFRVQASRSTDDGPVASTPASDRLLDRTLALARHPGRFRELGLQTLVVQGRGEAVASLMGGDDGPLRVEAARAVSRIARFGDEVVQILSAAVDDATLDEGTRVVLAGQLPDDVARVAAYSKLAQIGSRGAVMQLGYAARDSDAALEALRNLATAARGDIQKDAKKRLEQIEKQKKTQPTGR